MAQLAVAGLGAGLGFLVGGPVGAQIGFALGSVAGGALFPPEAQKIQGPRAADLRGSDSSFGTPINISYGTNRIAGQVFWSAPREEVATVEEQGGKGGGGASVEVTTFTYFQSFAVSFGEGIAENILRLWLNGTLVYDRTASGDIQQDVGLNFRFYGGDEDQLPDSIIEAAVGVGRTPAYRGQCYAVIDRLPLANTGNTLPKLIEAEIAMQAQPANPSTDTTFLGVTSWNTDSVFPDWERGFVYASDNNNMRILRIRINDMLQDRDIIRSTNGNLRAVLKSGFLFVESVGAVKVQLLDPNTFATISTFPLNTGQFTHGPTGFSLIGGPGRVTSFLTLSSLGLVEFILAGNGFSSVGLLKIDPLTQQLEFVSNSEFFAPDKLHGLCGATAQDAIGTAYILTAPTLPSTGNIRIGRITASAGAEYINGVSVGVTYAIVATLSPSQLLPGASSIFDLNGIIFDEIDGNLIITATESNATTNQYAIKLDAQNGNVIWRSLLPNGSIPADTGMNHSRVQNATYGFITGGKRYAIDTRTGALLEQASLPNIGSSNSSYDSRRSVAIATSNVSQPTISITKYAFFRASGLGEGLDTIVADLCERAGLDASEYDVSELVDSVRGFVVSRQSTVRASIEILARSFFFDGVESDYQIKFRKRGGTSVATIPQEHLGASGQDGNFFVETRIQEVELPERVTLLYLDKDKNYEVGAQQSKRISLPNRASTQSREELSFELPIVFQASDAKQIAERKLYEAWVSRISYASPLPWRYIRLDPADVVTFQLAVASFLTRLSEMRIQSGSLTLDVRALAEDAPVYSSAVSGDAGDGTPSPGIPSQDPTKLFVLNVPLLQDTDDLGGSVSRTYYAASHFNAAENWPGALIQRSTNSQLFETRTLVNNRVSWGSTLNALGNTSSPFRFDEVNTLTVGMAIGGNMLASVSDSDFLAGFVNAAIVGDEIIRFRDVTPNADGTYTLSYLLRGQRGTDVFTSGHIAGERFLLLNEQVIRLESITLALLGTTLFYRGVTRGTFPELAQIQSVVLEGRDLKPYAPVHAARADNTPSAGDITISWKRRTRLAGELRDSIDVPLAEASESYEVDILSGAGGSVVRTLSSTSQSVEYDTAQVVSDFGSPPATLYVRIYQISAAVGRGFSYQYALAAA